MALPTGMTLRQLTPDDIPAVVALGDAIWSTLYDLPSYLTAEFLAVQFTRPQLDPERDQPALFAADGLVGWAALAASPPMTEIVCPIGVDLALAPGERAACIDALVEELASAARARLTDADPGVRRMLGLFIPTRDSGMCEHVRGLGWTLLRTYYEMAITLTGRPEQEVELPAGMTLRTFADPGALESSIDVMVEAFDDHHGDTPSPEEWHHMLSAEVVLPGASYVLDDQQGSVASLVCSALGDGEGYVGSIGVRRRGRGRGAASALLRRAFDDLAAAGFATAKLDVDAENTTGALGFYERAGMSVRVAQEAWGAPLAR